MPVRIIDFSIDSEHPDSDIGFRMISLQGLSAFFMMFGLVGLALYRQSQVGVIISIVGAVAAGMGSVWVIGITFQGCCQFCNQAVL